MHFYVNKIPPLAFWHQAQSDKWFFQLLISGLTPVSLLKSDSWFEIVLSLADTGKDRLHINSLCIGTARKIFSSFLFSFIFAFSNKIQSYEQFSH
jgi:hypothetical protein